MKSRTKLCHSFELFLRTFPPPHLCWNQNPLHSYLQQKCTTPTTSQDQITRGFVPSPVPRKQGSHLLMPVGTNQGDGRNQTSAVNLHSASALGSSNSFSKTSSCATWSTAAPLCLTSSNSSCFCQSSVKRNVNSGEKHTHPWFNMYYFLNLNTKKQQVEFDVFVQDVLLRHKATSEE